MTGERQTPLGIGLEAFTMKSGDPIRQKIGAAQGSHHAQALVSVALTEQ